MLLGRWSSEFATLHLTRWERGGEEGRKGRKERNRWEGMKREDRKGGEEEEGVPHHGRESRAVLKRLWVRSHTLAHATLNPCSAGVCLI